MSTLNVSNITDGTTTVGTSYVVNGSAKAWVNFNGTGTIAARDSLNLSSLTDNGTGDYTVNFSNAFGAANFCFQLTGQTGATNATHATGGAVAPTTSAIRCRFWGTTYTTASDPDHLCASVHGDLA